MKACLLGAAEEAGNRMVAISNARLPKKPNKYFTRELIELPACHAFELRHDAPRKGPWRPNKITYSTSRSASASVTIGISIVVPM